MIRGEAQKLDELIDYLEDNWEGFYGSWSLRGKVKAQEVLPVLASSGEGVGEWDSREEHRADDREEV